MKRKVDSPHGSGLKTDQKLDKLITLVAEYRDTDYRADLKALVTVTTEQGRQIAEHTKQIFALMSVAKQHERKWQSLEKQWQAYLNTLPRN